MTNPRISIVATSRNDNHGGSLNRRMQIFITALIEQCKRHKLHAELIIVEWNPPADKASLANELSWPEDPTPCEVRILTVPRELHNLFKCSESLNLFQMIAKNVGIRRARGQFVLATNIDLLFSDELCAFLATAELDTNKLYRIDRHDVEKDVPLGEPIEKQLEYCQNNLIRLNAREGTFSLTHENFRVINEHDVVALDSGIYFDKGWFGTEYSVDGAAMRWSESQSKLIIRSKDQPRSLQLDIGPGPGVNYQPFELQAKIAEFGEAQCFRIENRRFITLNIPASLEHTQVVDFQIAGGGPQDPGWTRGLNFVVHNGQWVAEKRHKNVRPGFRHRVVDGLRRFYHKLRAGQMEGILYPRLLHTNGCGDFTMLAKDKWIEIAGYPELEAFSMHIDSLGVYEAYHAGLEEHVLTDPMRVYHIEHGSGWTPEGEEKMYEGLAKKGIRYLTYQDYLDYIAKMRQRNAPLLFNRAKGDSWGLGDHELKETVIGKSQ
jgi:hypothetical protein